MNKIIIITLGLLMSFALVSAGFTIPVLIQRWDGNVDITPVQESRIKLSSSVDKIDVDISPIECNNIECFAKISQPDVIHTTWRRAKSYCSEYSECNESEEFEKECQIECLIYKDYTLTENQLAIKKYINKRLGDYANAEEVRKGNSIGISEKKDAGGSLTSKVLVGRK
jgi:hypothetical protein